MTQFLPDPWRIVEEGLDPADRAHTESIFALANGHLGLRGNLEEPAGVAVPGTYVNGFFESTPIIYGETAHAFARNHQVMLNVVDGKRIDIEIDGAPLDATTGTLLAHRRWLDLRTGRLERRLRWRAPSGAVVEIRTRRLASLARPEVAAIQVIVRALEGHPFVRLRSHLDHSVVNQASGDDPRMGAHLPTDPLTVVDEQATELGGHVVERTANTGLELACAVEHRVTASGATDVNTATSLAPTGVALDVSGVIGTGACLQVEKHLAYVTRIPEAPGGHLERAHAVAEEARDAGFTALAREQREQMAAFWRVADVEVDGDPALQQGIRFNAFTVWASAGRDGRTGLAAKGLTGEGYDGHHFWDTEVFALPFLQYTQPDVARALLGYRYRTLNAARVRAVEMGEAGALYPWRTIGGEEASAYFPAGTAQYHINADIAFGVERYLAATGDHAFLVEGGAEIVFETARLWVTLGSYVPGRDGFFINEVTGPDEYHALVNNDLYTNVMARGHLRFAADLADRLREHEPEAWETLAARIGLLEAEVEAWRTIAAAMRIPYDTELGIHLQDDAFLDREPWDLAGTPPARRPLLLHYHPLVIYRHRVLKQPDVVLAQVLREEEFAIGDRRRNFVFYDELTTGDSSLAHCIQSVAAARLGFAELAGRYFEHTARIDLDDRHGNADHGLHVAAAAGTWFALVFGFAGLRDAGDRLRFEPRLPSAWGQLRFRLLVRGSLLEVALDHDRAVYRLLEGDPLELSHGATPLRLAAGDEAAMPLRPELRAVVFDLDGVLTDTAELHYRAWQRLADEEGLRFDRDVNERLRGVGRLDSLRIILEHAGAERPEGEMAALAERKNRYYRDAIGDIGPDDLLPGIPALLDELRDAGIGIAVASASHNAPDVLAALAIEDRIDALVPAGDVARGKPDPEIFLRAAEQLGVRTEDALGVEDAQVGIEAIVAAGMVAVGVGPVEGADLVGPTTDRLTLRSLRAAFERRRSQPGSRHEPEAGPAAVPGPEADDGPPAPGITTG
jgi:alpha,alpha-trehalose phosphorylase